MISSVGEFNSGFNSGIQLVLFDIGGVLINWHDSWLYRKVAQKYRVREDQLTRECKKEISRLHCGQVQESEFWKIIGKKINSEELAKINGSLIYEIFKEESKPKQEVLSLAKNIKNEGISIGVLSNLDINTNSVLDELQILEDFEFQFMSYEIGFAKPDKRIYEHVIRKTPFKKNELIVIDDKTSNIEAAKSVGIRSILYSNVERLQKDLQEIGIL